MRDIPPRPGKFTIPAGISANSQMCLGLAGMVALMAIDQHVLVSEFLRVLDLVGTFVFALSGAVSGVKHRIDLFGVLVLSFVAATAGGIVRDVLIGAIPPAAIQDWRYITLSMVAGVVTF